MANINPLHTNPFANVDTSNLSIRPTTNIDVTKLRAKVDQRHTERIKSNISNSRAVKIKQGSLDKIIIAKKNARSDRLLNIGSGIVKIFGLVLVFMLIIMLLRVMRGGAIPTFTSLFEKLSTAPVPNIPFINASVATLGDWGVVLNPLRNFISLFLDIFNVGIFITNGVLSIMTYAVWLLQWIFIL